MGNICCRSQPLTSDDRNSRPWGTTEVPYTHHVPPPPRPWGTNQVPNIRHIPPPVTGRTCHVCHRPATRDITNASNRTGNAGRPFYKCIPCDIFYGFDDERGIDPRHPPCWCGVPSRLQVAGPNRSRGLHYVCRSKACGFYGYPQDTQGRQISVTEDLVYPLARRAII